MFCPNCGRNCGTDRFCGSCGTTLQQPEAEAAKPSAWTVGMPCPHCGGTRLDGNHCAYCGAQLLLNGPDEGKEADSREDDSFVLPRMNFGWGDYVDLNETSFTYCGINFAKERHEQEIPYDSIKSVMYCRETEDYVRMAIEYCVEKSQTIYFSCMKRVELNYQFFCFLRTMVPSSVEFLQKDEYLSTDTSDKWLKYFDTEEFFNEYNPYQKRAPKKIQEVTALSDQEADSIAAKIIHTRQERLYKRNPSLAIRDLNRVIAEQEREKELESKEPEKRRRRFR